MTEAAEVKSLILELAAKAVLCEHIPDGACLECIINFGQAVALATYEDAARIVSEMILSDDLRRDIMTAIQRRAEELKRCGLIHTE